MNLSEIRKKAQQEKMADTGSVPPIAGNPTQNGPACAETPAEAVAESPRNAGAEERRPPGILLPDTPVAADFDPISVILAGRAATRGDVDKGNGDGSRGDADGIEFNEFLCFRVAAEKYAVDIMDIREIIKPRDVTEVPRMPPFISGVLSLRGIIIPLFDMRKRLGHAVAEKSVKERIIVVNRGEELCGVLVDEVMRVARLDAAAVEPPPAVLEGIDRDFVGGIGRIDGEMLILLNLEKILDMTLH
jgi:purine-binding chemotaxis protein CheW